MNSHTKHCVLVAAIAVTLLALIPAHAFGQQITYYDFNGPFVDSSQYSRSCLPPPASNPLFCLNGSATNPSFIPDTYPASIDPNLADDPPVDGTFEAVQMTPSISGQDASLWFSTPQNVANGFNAWFAFKFTPNNSSTTADGIAFVIQNSAATFPVTDPLTSCSESGVGPTALGGGGGCLGYSGINNSLALEFDTYTNGWGDPNNNHIALQGCGAGLPNSAAHGSCTVSTVISSPRTSGTIGNQVFVTLADNNVHQVVVVYNGPNETPANLYQVFLDPAYDPGTRTPVAGSIPVFSATVTMPTKVSLINGTSAYVGFTSATGESFEQHELMAWTFTPHTTVTQQEPLQPADGTTYTQFPYGTHTYAVQYPPDSSDGGSGPSTSGISMTVTANTVSPLLFSTLIAGTPFAGSTCQVYDDTGGNCVIYSASCFVTGSNPKQIVACPAVTGLTDCQGDNAAKCIAVKTVYNSSEIPPAPGYIQGDPFYSQISGLTVSGDTATFTCTGECAVSQDQTVSVVGAAPAGFNGSYTVTNVSSANQFTAQTAVGASGSATTPGFLTSSNVQNILTSWTAQNIDGGAKGTTLNFSDFVFTDNTVVPPTSMALNATTASPGPSQTDALIAKVTATIAQYGAPTGTVTFSSALPVTDANTLCGGPVDLSPSTALAAIATCSSYTAPATPGLTTVYATYNGDANHASSNNSFPITVSQATPIVTWPTASAITFGQTLASSTLSSGTASFNSIDVPGTFAFTTPTTTPNAGTPSESVTFTPMDTATYNSVTTTVPVTVNKAPVTIDTLPTAGAIAYGQTLASSTLTGGTASSTITSTTVPGTFTFTTPTTAPGAGTASQGITFTPTDSSDYTTATGSVSVMVNKASVAIMTPPTASAITFGQSLAASTLTGGVAKAGSTVVPGVFTYTTITTPSGAGTPSEGITFTPNDPVNYSGTTGSVAVLVNKAPTSISTAPTAGAILYGQTLAASTLSGGTAVSTITHTAVPGTFTFASPATAPTATGAQGVTFTPTDTIDYLGTTGSASVAVTPGPLAKISPSSFDFGTLYLGDIRIATVAITNTGNAAMTISSPLLAILKGGNSNEFATVNLCPKSLAAGKSCTMVVTFIAGPFYTPQTAKLTIMDNVLGAPQTVQFTATVINPVVALNPASLSFGTVKTSKTLTKSITVTSAGGTPLSITGVSVTGSNAGDFTASTNCSGPLNPKATCSISVTFQPGAKGVRSATLLMTGNERISPRQVPLSGTGN